MMTNDFLIVNIMTFKNKIIKNRKKISWQGIIWNADI